jgi:hypothetical protein
MALHGGRGAAQVAVVGFAALLFTYFWLSRFKLIITPDKLLYSSLFTGERVIAFSEISASDIHWQRGFYGAKALLQLKSRGVTTRLNF